MDHPSEDNVKKVLSDFHSRIRSIVDDAYSEWVATRDWKASKGYHSIRYQRTVANAVFDAIANNACSEFAQNSRVRVITEPQTIKLCFDGSVVGRFKKGNHHDLGSNVPTQAVFDYIDQQQQLPNFPPEAAKIEFIWSADDLGEAISHVLVVARDKEQLLWSYNLDAPEEPVNVLSIPSPFDEDPDDTDESMVMLRKTEEKRNESE